MLALLIDIRVKYEEEGFLRAVDGMQERTQLLWILEDQLNTRGNILGGRTLITRMRSARYHVTT